ncbi:MAG: hypothetical protein Q9202_000172 [Teloschistes flavicans]
MPLQYRPSGAGKSSVSYGVKDVENDTQAVFRRNFALRPEKGRSRTAKLAIFRKEKAYWRQRRHHRHASWSHDWREPLKDLEEASDLGVSNVTAAPLPFVDKRVHNVRADEITWPKVWTKLAFDRYVFRLTTSTMDRLVARKLYLGKKGHLDAVADALEDLFFDEELKYVFGGQAARRALNFFLSSGSFVRGRKIFGRLQELQRDAHPSTFNIMLRVAAEEQDLFHYTYILKKMISCGVRPNELTWLYLAQAVPNEEVRQLIIQRMSMKGYLKDTSVSTNAAALVIPHMAGKYLDSGGDPQRLLDSLDEQFGPDWHLGRASARVIDEVGIRQSTQRALAVLQTLQGRGYQPSRVLLMLLLRQCSWLKEHELAVEILRKFRMEYNVVPAETRICDVLFNQAWRSRLHNCCKVIWTYAYIRGCTSYDMQEKVKRSLCNEPSEDSAKKSRSVMWEEGAGHVITSRVERISLHRLKRLMLMWQPAEPGRDRSKSEAYLRVMRRIVDQDLNDVGKAIVLNHLDTLLAEALNRDRLWQADRVLQTVPLECRYTQVYHPFRSIVKDEQSEWNNPGLPTTPQEERRDPVFGMTPAKRDLESSGCCWMSADTRLRACICPEYVRKKHSDLHTSDRREDSHEQPEKAAEEAAEETAEEKAEGKAEEKAEEKAAPSEANG